MLARDGERQQTAGRPIASGDGRPPGRAAQASASSDFSVIIGV
jgi:hypothetical protein